MRFLWSTVSFVALLVTSGCANMAYKAQLPDVSTNCVGSLREMTVIPLRYPAPADDSDPKYIEFANVARCYRPTGAGAMPVALYRLDGITPPAELNVSVMLSTGGTFAASVDILDADFQRLNRYAFDKFVRRGSQYSLNVFVNATDEPAAYLLLIPDPSQVGKSDTAIGSATTTVPLPAGPVMFMYHAGSETNSVRPFLEGGRILVTARPQSSASFIGD